MKIVFDILGSTERSGGMRLHSTELLRSWIQEFPEDQVTLVAGSWAIEEFSASVHRVASVSNEGVIGRAIGQLIRTPLVALRERPDAVISMSPIVSPFVPKRIAYCFQHDWRHKKNPREFPRLQRVYRRLWEISADHANLNICISEKAQQETLEIVPSAKTMVIENGWDHARRWGQPPSSSTPRSIVTFGHHNNKRPELLIRALPLLEEGNREVNLTILGARGRYASDLRDLAVRLGVNHHVDLPGFVSESEYERLVMSASAIALVSSDEGFGLPIAEAAYFGIPSLITSDSGMSGIFGGVPIVADPDPESIALRLAECLDIPRAREGRAVRSWDNVAQELRTAVSVDGKLRS